MSDQKPILYSFIRCPYAIRARMALIYAHIQCHLREVDLKHKPAHLLKISPKGTVPVLLLPDHSVIDESLDIMQWAVTQHDPSHIKNSMNLTVVNEIQKCFTPLVRRYKYSEEGSLEQNMAKKGVAQCLADFERQLTQQSYFSGAQWGLTDLAVFPFFRQCALVDPDWFATQNIPTLQHWLQQPLNSDLFQQCMQKTEPWQPDDLPIIFPSSDAS